MFLKIKIKKGGRIRCYLCVSRFYMLGKSIKRCAIPGCRIEPASLHSLPKDPNIRNEWLKFLLTDIPDRYSPTLTICSAHFSPDSFVNLSQFNAGYARKLLLNEGRVPTIFDRALNPQPVSKISYSFFYYM